MPRPEREIVLSDFDESRGITLKCNKENDTIRISAWYNDIEYTPEYEIKVEDILRVFNVPITVIKNVYDEDAFLLFKKLGAPKKVRSHNVYERKTKKKLPKDLFKWNRNKPQVELVCKYSGCGKIYTVPITDKKRSYCSTECANLAFKEGIESGEYHKRSKEAIQRRKEINAKISATKLAKKAEKLRLEKEAKEKEKEKNDK